MRSPLLSDRRSRKEADSPVGSQPTGDESLVERWILQKLNHATVIIDKALTERNFMAATAEAYRFWLYDICDVYIVRI